MLFCLILSSLLRAMWETEQGHLGVKEKDLRIREIEPKTHRKAKTHKSTDPTNGENGSFIRGKA